MPREKFKTLTQQMFYVLLCLEQECCGIDLMDRVRELTEGTVRVGSGTLYHLLDEFLAAGLIRETRVEGRRRSYLLTPEGHALLREEYCRICRQAEDYCRVFGKEPCK